MLGLIVLVVFAIFLLMMHVGVRHGLKRSAFSASEAFVLGHWPFIYFNGIVLYYTEGTDWTSLAAYNISDLVIATTIVAIGLLSFVCGGWISSEHCKRISPSTHIFKKSPSVLFFSGATMMVVGVTATWLNFSIITEYGFKEKSTVLLAFSQLSVPGALFCYFAAKSKKLWWFLRLTALLLFVVAIVALLFEWSRRLLVIVAIGAILLRSFLKIGYIKRRLVFYFIPLLLIMVLALLIWRLIINFNMSIDSVFSYGWLSFYLDRLWLEMSAFSSLIFIIEYYGMSSFLGGESFLAPFIFFIPRSFFPWKPEGFDLGKIIGTPYTLAPSIYGEIIVNFTVFGLIPIMMLIGYLVKRIDLRFKNKSSSIGAKILYVMFVFNFIFVVRGSFQSTVTPIIIQCLLPLSLLALFGIMHRDSSMQISGIENIRVELVK